MRCAALLSTLAFCLALATPVVAASPPREIQEYQGNRYACTGVGDDERADPQWQEFPLKMVFTTGDGDFLGDVRVSIADATGATVVEAHCMAPWLVADLATGIYTARVVALGLHEENVDFEIEEGEPTNVVVAFAEIRAVPPSPR